MDALPADTTLFANEAWTLTPAGLEHRNGYFIDRAEIAARRHDGMWSWPLQIAEKLWCAPRPFVEAFLRALLAFGVEPDASLARSLEAVRDHPGHPLATDGDPLPLASAADAAVRAGRRRFHAIEIEQDPPIEAPRRAA